ncbi:hypothetical protein [Actinoallomurus soli]|uniref:hypothetical protein n=1 Tax=Actinoallomurus soli TaxID=2952535 RepID=UPI0020930BC2|nr:hypothetical protein [Actinoallomurus soli]MCO5968107.1 hypothetical protein [Actinoallomurus soli]
MLMKVEGVYVSTCAHIPENTALRVVRHADEEITSVRFGEDELLVVELDDAMVPTLIEAIQGARQPKADTV